MSYSKSRQTLEGSERVPSSDTQKSPKVFPWLSKALGLAPPSRQPEWLQLCGILALGHTLCIPQVLPGPGTRWWLGPGKSLTSAGLPVAALTAGHKEVN